MSIPTAIFLGFVQGLTEFLPVSSSGHLVLLQKVLGFAEPPIFFDVLAHAGTLLAVVVFFRGGLRWVIRERGVIRGIVVGTLPIVLAGLVLQPFVGAIFNSLLLVSAAYFVTAALLWWSRGFGEGKVGLGEVGDRRALVVGIFQAAAILPGVSRSGATIVGGLYQKLNREAAFAFSFYLFVPAILGALVLQLKDMTTVSVSWADFWGMLAAFVVGYFSLVVLKRVLLLGKLYYFSFYCAFLGVVSFSIFLISR